MRLRVEKRLFSALYSLVQMRVYPPYPIGAKEFRSVTILTFRHIYFTDSRKTIWRNCFAPGWITLPNTYIKKLDLLPNNGYDVRVDSKVVKRACGYLSKAVAHYLNGFPSKAYSSFKSAMNIFMDKPLKIYQKSAIEQFEDRRNHHNTDDSLFFLCFK